MMIHILFCWTSLYSSESSVFYKLYENAIKQELDIEIYYLSLDFLFNIYTNEERIIKYCSRKVEWAKYKKIKASEYKEVLSYLKNIDIEKVEQKKANDLRMLLFFKNGNIVQHKVGVGSYLTIDGQVYKNNQEIRNIFEDIIAPGERERRQEYLDGMKTKKK